MCVFSFLLFFSVEGFGSQIYLLGDLEVAIFG